MLVEAEVDGLPAQGQGLVVLVEPWVSAGWMS